ncbi:SMI1/KNR4 family protein [Streptomyces sp. NPDC020983]|uniref:SMI1/KNR4 family protein n=1 Tax=Streptomyces sp. NPDC020983 TaxID=3365106 RepID=UPI003791211B
MSGLDELLLRVRDRAERETEVLAPCVREQDVVAAEQALGFNLPPLLRLLYLHVANGGFGPDYTLLPLVGSGRTVVGEYGPLLDARPAHWPRGVLPILDWGCGMYAAVDCLDPVAPVLLFEPNAGPEDWADAWFLDSPSLAQWLDTWLAGTGWWEDEVVAAEDAHEPVPWPGAVRRLATAG